MKIQRFKNLVLMLIVWFVESHAFAEAITADSVDSFKISIFDRQLVREVADRHSRAASNVPVMPPKLTNVVPQVAESNQKRPAGCLPIAIDPKTQEVVVLLGQETGTVSGFTDFGGSSESGDVSREHTAVREFNEETCLAFWSDVSNEASDMAELSGADLESMAKKPVTDNLYPLLYVAKNKYYTCLVPVSYLSVPQLNSMVELVRTKVMSAHFFEKQDFVWVPLETFIQWIKENNENPKIPGKPGSNISWRFLGGAVSDFTSMQEGHKGLQDIYRRTMKYLNKIIEINKE